MNCWEMVLFAAYKAGCVTREWLTKLYGKTTLSGNALSNWYANLPGRMASPIQTYQGGWNSGLRRGDIVFFNGASHVAIATGTKDRFGNDQVISHWIPNNRRVEVTTIQALRQMYPSTVTFGRPAWNTARLT
jgi:cell wall-associated NlpC family hydrolase